MPIDVYEGCQCGRSSNIAAEAYHDDCREIENENSVRFWLKGLQRMYQVGGYARRLAELGGVDGSQAVAAACRSFHAY